MEFSPKTFCNEVEHIILFFRRADETNTLLNYHESRNSAGGLDRAAYHLSPFCHSQELFDDPPQFRARKHIQLSCVEWRVLEFLGLGEKEVDNLCEMLRRRFVKHYSFEMNIRDWFPFPLATCRTNRKRDREE